MTITTVPIASSKQLPRWIFEPRPGETIEQAAARIAALYPGKPVTVYVLAGRAFIQHPESE